MTIITWIIVGMATGLLGWYLLASRFRSPERRLVTVQVPYAARRRS